MSYLIRPWALRDVKDVMWLIREAAMFHKALDQVKTTPEALQQDGFRAHPKFGCLVAEVPPKQRSGDVSPGPAIVGYQFHYFTYCTWEGRILFGEDLYVRPEFRGKGIGTSLLRKVAKVAQAHGCVQFRFVSANWNGQATALYKKLGAVDVTARDNWNLWHIEGPAVRQVAAGGNAMKSSTLEAAGGENPGVRAPSPPPALTTSHQSPSRAGERTQESWLPAPAAPRSNHWGSSGRRGTLANKQSSQLTFAPACVDWGGLSSLSGQL